MPIGRAIPQDLVDAIEARENLISSEEKTSEAIKFTHGRSSFALLRSLVKIEDSFDLAKSVALSSGTGLKSRSGIDSATNQNASTSESAYYQSEVFGFRPMPGITNINSTVLGGYGAVRKTVISFKANSVDDLDVLNRVYMHFGATVLLEFGHTVYLNSDGEVKNMTFGDMLPQDTIYKDKPSLNNLRKLVAENSETKNYSYEGVVGYVYNFDFAFQQDGTYDCSITIKSHNGVTDSLSVPSTVDSVKKYRLTKSPEPEVSTKGLNNVVESLCTKIQEYSGTPGKYKLGDVLDKVQYKFDGWSGAADYDIWISWSGSNVGPVTERDANLGFDSPRDASFAAYLPLRFWLALFNVFAMPRIVGSGSKDESFAEKMIVRWSMRSNGIRRFLKQFSLNPQMVLPPYVPTGDFEKNYTITNKNNKGRDGDLPGISAGFGILDIKVSTALMRKVNENFVANNPKKNDEIGLTDFVELLLDEIQKYLGDINSFEIATFPTRLSDDRVYEELEIYDKATPAQTGRLLNLTGLSTTVTALNIKSNISNNIATAAMLGGAGSKGGGGKTQTGIEKYNTLGKKASDALAGTMFTSGVSIKETEDSNNETVAQIPFVTSDEKGEKDDMAGESDIREIIHELYDVWNGKGFAPFEAILDASKSYLQSTVGAKALGKFMPIPVEVSFELLGIGGFKNLETFTLPDHLVPPRFGNTHFIITSVEHSLDSSDSMWKTSITGQLKPTN